MTNYKEIDVDAPIADAFARRGITWARTIIDVGAIAGMSSVLLVQFMAQARIFFAIGRDGLLPRGFFAAIHSKYGSPWVSTIFTAGFVTLVSTLLPLELLAEMVSIGTLSIFILVALGVIILRVREPEAKRGVKLPFGVTIPVLSILACLALTMSLSATAWIRFGIWLLLGLLIYRFYGLRHGANAKAASEGEKREGA